MLKYPTLLQAININKNKSWFDIKSQKNKNINHNYNNINHEYKYTHTKKIVLNLTKDQREKIQLWLNECIDIYNITNRYIKSKIYINNTEEYINRKEFNVLVNFFNLRKILTNELKNICKQNNLPKHSADYQVKHCVEMYKSAYKNFINNHIKKFNVSDLLKDRKRKNMIIEPVNVSKKSNTIFKSIFKNIDSNIPLNIIEKNSILQYNKINNSFLIITPLK